MFYERVHNSSEENILRTLRKQDIITTKIENILKNFIFISWYMFYTVWGSYVAQTLVLWTENTPQIRLYFICFSHLNPM